jgi:hypothetical protein
MRARIEQASTTYQTKPRTDLCFWTTILPDGRQSYGRWSVKKRWHLHARRRLIQCRTNWRLTSHGFLLSLRVGRRFLYDTHLSHGDWTHGVIMIAALGSHSIGVLSVYSQHPRRLSDLFVSILSFLGGEKQSGLQSPSLFAFYTRCRGAIGPDMFYHFSKGLAGYPFVFRKRNGSKTPLPRELSFPLSSIPNRIFL